MRIRPSIIGKPVTGGLFSLARNNNQTSLGSPNTVFGGQIASDTRSQAGGTLQHAWYQFLQPYFNPTFVLAVDHQASNDPGFIETSLVQAMDSTVVWDHTTLTWNTEPTRPSGAPEIDFQSGPTADFGLIDIQNLVVFDCTKGTTRAKQIFNGLYLQSLGNLFVGGSGGASIQATDVFLLDDPIKNPHKALHVAQRQSATMPSDIRTLVFTEPHHLLIGAVLIQIAGVGPAYNANNVTVTAIPDAVTIQYAGTSPLTEALTSSGGTVELFATGY